MLRLLPKKELARKVEDHKNALSREKSALSEEISKLTLDRNLLLSEMGEREREYREKMALVSSQHEEKVRALLSEVSSLEARKKEALKPIKDREKICSDREQEIEKTETSLALVRKSLEEDRTELVVKLAEISDRKSEAQSLERKADEKMARLMEAEAMNRKSTEALADAWAKFRGQEAEKLRLLEAWALDMERKEAETKKERKWCVDERSRLVAERKALQSERAAVQDAYDRAKKKGIL